MIKVALTDDHDIVLRGLQQMLLEDKSIGLVGAYTNGKALLEGLTQSLPDVLLLDLQLPDYNGEELARKVLSLYPDLKIMVLSSIDEPKRVREMLGIGCLGYSLKNISQTSLINAIEKIHRGGQFIDPAIQAELMRELLTQEKLKEQQVPELTRREKEILDLIAEGISSPEIAERLFLSVRTVDNHRNSLLQKFEVKNAIALLKAARKFKIID